MNAMTQDHSSTLRVRFLCLARNCEATIPRFLEYLQRLDEAGVPCAALVGENGSTDRTRSLLDHAAGPRLQVLDTAFMQGVPGRLTRMAMGREALLAAAKALHGPEEFVCVADLDNVMLSPPSPDALKAAFASLNAETGLFAVGATSDPFYYDVLSLQADGHDYSTLHAEIAEAKRKPLSYFQFHKTRIYANQIRATTAEPLHCQSSFNGFCLYKADSYYQGTYRSPDEALLCEHVSFHRSLRQATGQHMMILPTLKLKMPADHGPVSFWRFWLDRLRKLA